MFLFEVADMTCGHCAARISQAVASFDQHAHVETSVADRLVRITGTGTEEDYATAIRESGYTPAAAQQAVAPTPSGCCCARREPAAAVARDGEAHSPA
ncbi:MAG: heavy-metal-associated domain-containing protein [Burkholderiales bacterium]|nr:heavy-metal-associated domain-containing protein [Burkholderiales bacterium]